MSEYPLAIVTGAGHRLGRLFALRLARRGYAIVLHYHMHMQEAYDTAEEIRALDVPVYLQAADLTQLEEIEGCFTLVAGLPHPLKVLVNSAAVMKRGAAGSLSLADWDETLDLNLRAPFLCAQKAAAQMKEGGLIVNISDVAAQKSWDVFPAYTVSKAALESLTRVLARAFAPGVRVNCIAPGLAMPSEVVSEEQWKRLVDRLPMGRLPEPAELEAALDYLIDNPYVTGQSVVVDGGYSLL